MPQPPADQRMRRRNARGEAQCRFRPFERCQLVLQLCDGGAADAAIDVAVVVLFVAGGKAGQPVRREGHRHDQVGRGGACRRVDELARMNGSGFRVPAAVAARCSGHDAVFPFVQIWPMMRAEQRIRNCRRGDLQSTS